MQSKEGNPSLLGLKGWEGGVATNSTHTQTEDPCNCVLMKTELITISYYYIIVVQSAAQLTLRSLQICVNIITEPYPYLHIASGLSDAIVLYHTN